MENIETSKLLDLIWELENKSIKDKNGSFNWDKFGEVAAELRKRFPFSEILGTKDDPNDSTLEEKVEELLEEVKLLKRHKHDNHSGDVLVRI